MAAPRHHLEPVQEVLCLIQGSPGKWFSLRRTPDGQIVLTVQPKQSPGFGMEPPQIQMVQRLACLGIWERTLSVKCGQLAGHSCPVRQQLGTAVRHQLLEYCGFLTELHARVRTLTLLKLNGLLYEAHRKFQYLDQTIRQLEGLTASHLIGQLLARTSTGDRLLDHTTRQLIGFVLRPVTGQLRRRLLPKPGYHDPGQLPNLFHPSLVRLITKLGCLVQQCVGTGGKPPSFAAELEPAIDLILEQADLASLTLANQSARMKLFEQRLQAVYQDLNRALLDQLRATVQDTRKLVARFLFHSWWQCCPTTDPRPLPLQYNRQGGQPALGRLLTAAGKSVLLGPGTGQLYEQLWVLLSQLKLVLAQMLDCCKQARAVYFRITSGWEEFEAIKPGLKRICYAFHELLGCVLERHSQVHCCLLTRWNRFARKLSASHMQAIKLEAVHEAFVSGLLSQVRDILLQDGRYTSIAENVATFHQQLEGLLEQAERTHRAERTRWHEDKLEGRAQCLERLEATRRYLVGFLYAAQAAPPGGAHSSQTT